MNSREKFLNQIDDYVQTVHAIVGFMNFYRHDDAAEKMKDKVKVFQGRRLRPSPEKAFNSNVEKISYVTPDIGILLPSRTGVIGEVKRSFPRKEEFWMKTFEQLMSYDDDLTGWPSTDGKVSSHDIVLILHLTREAKVCRFYDDKKDSEIKFSRPFVIVQFSRLDERQSYYYFQTRRGELTEKSINKRLADGVSVPMEVFVGVYSEVKIYDSKPPLPYLLELMWTYVVLPHASDDPRFERLHKKQKIEVLLTIDEIVDELHQGFSFHRLHGDDSEFQPKIPKKEWIRDACEQLVNSKDASWVDSDKKSIKFLFRRYDQTLEHFIEICSGSEKQMKLFEDDKVE